MNFKEQVAEMRKDLVVFKQRNYSDMTSLLVKIEDAFGKIYTLLDSMADEMDHRLKEIDKTICDVCHQQFQGYNGMLVHRAAKHPDAPKITVNGPVYVDRK